MVIKVCERGLVQHLLSPNSILGINHVILLPAEIHYRASLSCGLYVCVIVCFSQLKSR